jgi:preprotein translocase subunit YajC
MTTGGLLAKVVAVNEHYAKLEISKGVEIKVQKSSVSAVVPKGTIEAA